MVYKSFYMIYISSYLFSSRVFKRAARTNAQQLVLVGSSEWQRGMVGVKILSTGEQYEVKLDDLK